MTKLRVTYKTAWHILHRLIITSRYLLDSFAENNNTYLGTTTHGKKRGRGTEKAKIMWTFRSWQGLSETRKMVVKPNLKSITVGKSIRRSMVMGTPHISDNAKTYKEGLA